MWPFSKKYNLLESSAFSSFNDCHCHILPGVDDGIQTLDDSLAVLSYYEQIGIKEVWLTPHIMEDIPNTPEKLRAAFAKLTEAYNATLTTDSKGITLHLSAENMIDSLLVKRLEQNNLLLYGTHHDSLLVETSYVQAPYGFHSILRDIQSAGLYPVLAHPERYRYMDYDDYDTLKSQGIRFQLNMPSLAGAYGKSAQERSLYLLEQGYYDYRGTDLHSLQAFQRSITTKSLKKSQLELLEL